MFRVILCLPTAGGSIKMDQSIKRGTSQSDNINKYIRFQFTRKEPLVYNLLELSPQIFVGETLNGIKCLMINTIDTLMNRNTHLSYLLVHHLTNGG